MVVELRAQAEAGCPHPGKNARSGRCLGVAGNAAPRAARHFAQGTSDQDAARVADHEVAGVRKVTIGSRKAPYWEAGAAYLPYAQGYLASSPVMIWAFEQPAV